MDDGHAETIKCPECGEIQEAFVEHTVLWNVYIHECITCGYIIMESEWEEVTVYERTRSVGEG